MNKNDYLELLKKKREKEAAIEEPPQVKVEDKQPTPKYQLGSHYATSFQKMITNRVAKVVNDYQNEFYLNKIKDLAIMDAVNGEYLTKEQQNNYCLKGKSEFSCKVMLDVIAEVKKLNLDAYGKKNNVKSRIEDGLEEYDTTHNPEPKYEYRLFKDEQGVIHSYNYIEWQNANKGLLNKDDIYNSWWKLDLDMERNEEQLI